MSTMIIPEVKKALKQIAGWDENEVQTTLINRCTTYRQVGEGPKGQTVNAEQLKERLYEKCGNTNFVWNTLSTIVARTLEQ